MGVWLSEGDEQGKESENENDDFAAGLAMHVLSDGGAYTPLVQYDTYTTTYYLSIYIFTYNEKKKEMLLNNNISPNPPPAPSNKIQPHPTI